MAPLSNDTWWAWIIRPYGATGKGQHGGRRLGQRTSHLSHIPNSSRIRKKFFFEKKEPKNFWSFGFGFSG
jgi:hypothetical protein